MDTESQEQSIIRARKATCLYLNTHLIINILTRKMKIPLKEQGSVEDIAALTAFLASDDARYITGQVIACDGGMTM